MRIEEYRDMIYACGRCNFCHGADFNERCPEVYTQYWESSTARGRMAIARGILEGKLKYTPELAERIFGCFLCARCREECKKAAKIDIISITKAMRADFVEQGVKIPEGGSSMANTAIKTGNIFADPPKVHAKWSQGLTFKKGSGTLFFPGCLASHRFKEKTNILVRVLQAAGYELDFLGEEQTCCGTPLWITGTVKDAKGWAKSYMDKLKVRKVKEIITPCPSCYRAFVEEYPHLLGLKELPIRVRHTSEVLAEIVEQKRLKLTKQVNKTVTYHDPCEIGRYRGIYEPPRKALAAIPGLKVAELSRNRAEAFCCGGGGGVKIMYGDHSQRASDERLRDVIATGAELISTVCPACELNLTHATYEAGVEMRVLDIAEIMAVSAGVAPAEILEADYIPED